MDIFKCGIISQVMRGDGKVLSQTSRGCSTTRQIYNFYFFNVSVLIRCCEHTANHPKYIFSGWS